MPFVDAEVQGFVASDLSHFKFVDEFILFNISLGGCFDEIGKGSVVPLGKSSEKPVGIFTETKRDCFRHDFSFEYVIFLLSLLEYTSSHTDSRPFSIMANVGLRLAAPEFFQFPELDGVASSRLILR
jgi:hypothetical protein